MKAISHLHTGRMGIAVHRNHFTTQTLELQHHFTTQLTRTAEKNANGARRKRRTQHKWHISHYGHPEKKKRRGVPAGGQGFSVVHPGPASPSLLFLRYGGNN